MKTKLFCVMVIATILVCSCTSLAEDFTSNIKVVFDTVKLKVNGKAVSSSNILYNGRTYVQLRDVSEMFGKTVIWDDETKTASIDDSEIIPASKGIDDFKKSDFETLDMYIEISKEYVMLERLVNDGKSFVNTLYTASNAIGTIAEEEAFKSSNDTLNLYINFYNKEVDYIKELDSKTNIDISPMYKILNTLYKSIDSYKSSYTNLCSYKNTKLNSYFTTYLNDNNAGFYSCIDAQKQITEPLVSSYNAIDNMINNFKSKSN